jgi:hypothetical protein
MRWVRWALGGIVAVGLLWLVGAAFVGGSKDCPAASLTVPAVSFLGTAQAKDGAAVTFGVEQWSDDRLPPGTPERLSAGDVVVVRYSGGDERFVHVGQRYQVDAWGETPDDLASGVQTADECPVGGSATLHADGTPINTGLFTRDGIEPYTGRILVGALLLAAVTGAVVAYRRVKHPRLTIDGRPRH